MKIKDSRFIKNYILNQQSTAQGMQQLDVSSIPFISQNEVLELGKFLAYDDSIAALREGEGFIWHIAMPKSGSTWVSQVLSYGLGTKGWKAANLIPKAERREQEISTSEILRQNLISEKIFTIQQHTPYSEYTLDVIKKMNIKVILQVRNIADCIMSALDHFDQEAVVGPMMYISKTEWQALSYQRKLEYLVDFFAPWLIKFWVGWSTAIKEQSFDYILVNYDELKSDSLNCFTRLANFCDEKVTIDEVNHWLAISANVNTRKNKGVIGRGRELPEPCVKQLKRLMSYYPEVDFTPIGIV